MVLANYIRQNLLEPLKERQHAEGHARRRRWNARREKAEANGEPFDEPPPDLE